MGETTRNPKKTFFKFLAGVSKTIAAVASATAFRVLYWWRQHCKQISNGCLKTFKKIITLLTVTVLFLFTFFNLILDAPRLNFILRILSVRVYLKRSWEMVVISHFVVNQRRNRLNFRLSIISLLKLIALVWAYAKIGHPFTESTQRGNQLPF
jgi:hypothetical protein